MAPLRKTVKSLNRSFRLGLAVVTVVVGFAVMWGSSVGGARKKTAFNEVAAKAISVDATFPDRSHNGKFVVAQGVLSSEELLGDEFVLPGRYLVLRRRVEMYQWQEKRGPSGIDYELGWYEGENDSFKFEVQAGHENPLLKIQPESKRVSVARFGSFDGTAIIDAIGTLTPLQLEPAVLSDKALETSDNKIIVRRSLRGGDSYALGDMRLSYEVLPMGEYTVASIQDNERMLLGSNPHDGTMIAQGKISVQDLFEEGATQAERGFGSLLLVGAFVLFVGLVSLLSPLAPTLDLRPTVNVRGGVGVVFLSFAITAVVASVFGLLAFVG
jgi:hypothetical protein